VIKKLFYITASFNGEIYKKRSKDIRNAILSLKPETLYTEVYFTVSTGSGKNKDISERRLNLTQAKRIFSDETALDIFINNLLLQ
jgi:hypothetical protein